MSQLLVLGLALLCVCLTATAQILLKMGMSSADIQQALDNSLKSVYWLALSNPLIWAGMICFGASAGLWLLVLGKLDVSTAYPLIALGFVLTTLAGIFLLGESVNLYKALGTSLIVAGVLTLSVQT